MSIHLWYRSQSCRLCAVFSNDFPKFNTIPVNTLIVFLVSYRCCPGFKHYAHLFPDQDSHVVGSSSFTSGGFARFSGRRARFGQWGGGEWGGWELAGGEWRGGEWGGGELAGGEWGGWEWGGE